ncbi:TolC family outer membrane protein [Phenylobacterium sp. LjRoot219]|uniref:TolC family outer membrane protein n=1 Tax=Phenylobacterium sp. LjRoot219 TaxID=3342283 RepID=UPI003ED03D1B
MTQSLRQRVLSASLSLGLLAGAAAPAAAETLADALAAAYENNPTLQAQRATQRVIDEEYVQARTGWRPTLSASANAAWQEIRTPASERARLDRPTDRAIVRGNAGAAQLTFSQPLWTGGRVASSVTAANADVLQGRENLRRLEGQVMLAVITSYVDVRRDQENLRIQQENLKVLQAQLEESKARFDVGEVTRTDVAQSQSRLANSQAQLANAEAQLAASRATYATLVGHNPGTLQAEPSLAYLMPGNVDDAFVLAEQNSPLLRAQEFAEQGSRARIAGARAERMPNLSLQSTLRWGNAPIDPFHSDMYDTEKTASLNVSIPLFTGGLINSRVRQSIERNNADRITVEAQRRNVLQTITQAWNQLIASRANIVSTDEQVRAAKIAAEGTHQEEQVGLRTTLDVLNAEQELRAAQLSQVTARRDEYVAAATVLASMGRLEARNLIPSQPQYDATANYRRLRITWGWVPWEEPIGVVDGAIAYPAIPKAKDKALEPAISPGLLPPPAGPAAAPAAAAPAASPAPAAPPAAS